MDRQMEKFALPPEAGVNSLNEAEQAAMPIILKIHSNRKKKIKDSLTHWVNFLYATEGIQPLVEHAGDINVSGK